MARHKVEISGVNTANIKVLTTEEMNELFKRVKNGDTKAREELVNGNLKLVLSILPTKDDMNYVELDMAETKLIDLYNEAESLPLGYDKKVVVADNFFYLTTLK